MTFGQQGFCTASSFGGKCNCTRLHTQNIILNHQKGWPKLHKQTCNCRKAKLAWIWHAPKGYSIICPQPRQLKAMCFLMMTAWLGLVWLSYSNTTHKPPVRNLTTHAVDFHVQTCLQMCCTASASSLSAMHQPSGHEPTPAWCLSSCTEFVLSLTSSLPSCSAWWTARIWMSLMQYYPKHLFRQNSFYLFWI